MPEPLTLCISNSELNNKSKVRAFNKLSVGGGLIALKSATAHTRDRYAIEQFSLYLR